MNLDSSETWSKMVSAPGSLETDQAKSVPWRENCLEVFGSVKCLYFVLYFVSVCFCRIYMDLLFLDHFWDDWILQWDLDFSSSVDMAPSQGEDILEAAREGKVDALRRFLKAEPDSHQTTTMAGASAKNGWEAFWGCLPGFGCILPTWHDLCFLDVDTRNFSQFCVVRMLVPELFREHHSFFWRHDAEQVVVVKALAEDSSLLVF